MEILEYGHLNMQLRHSSLKKFQSLGFGLLKKLLELKIYSCFGIIYMEKVSRQSFVTFCYYPLLIHCVVVAAKIQESFMRFDMAVYLADSELQEDLKKIKKGAELIRYLKERFRTNEKKIKKSWGSKGLNFTHKALSCGCSYCKQWRQKLNFPADGVAADVQNRDHSIAKCDCDDCKNLRKEYDISEPQVSLLFLLFFL